MAFELPKLAYAYDALEPHIDARTMDIHHSKHHQAYINNANNALSGTAFADTPVEKLLKNIREVPDNIRQGVINNAGGHANHALFWQIMGPGGGGAPSGALSKAIDNQLGGFENFKEEFAKAGATRFGSGWAWLVIDGGKKLQVMSTANQDSPLMDGHTPILGLDVWEHAYYLHYQNRRPDYIAAWWQVVNWSKVDELYNKAMG